MPALGTMFDHKCKPLFNYGSGYRNTIKWSNSGRYVALCGFGNLPGDIGEIEPPSPLPSAEPPPRPKRSTSDEPEQRYLRHVCVSRVVLRARVLTRLNFRVLGPEEGRGWESRADEKRRHVSFGMVALFAILHMRHYLPSSACRQPVRALTSTQSLPPSLRPSFGRTRGRLLCLPKPTDQQLLWLPCVCCACVCCCACWQIQHLEH